MKPWLLWTLLLMQSAGIFIVQMYPNNIWGFMLLGLVQAELLIQIGWGGGNAYDRKKNRG